MYHVEGQKDLLIVSIRELVRATSNPGTGK